MNENETKYFDVEEHHELEGTDGKVSAVKLNGKWFELDEEKFEDTGFISHELLYEDMLEYADDKEYLLVPVYVEAVPGTGDTFIVGYKVTLLNRG